MFLGLNELVVPGEDSRNKQLREIQQLLASAPIVLSMQPSGVAHAGSLNDAPAGFGAGAPLESSGTEGVQASTGGESPASTRAGVHESPVTSHQSQVLVLPSVPVDQLLDDHAVEFEECKRWANSEAGQSAKITNPAGFANVRAHTEAHLRAMSIAAGAATDQKRAASPAYSAPEPQAVRNNRVSPPPPPNVSADRDGPGDHWVTIDGHHVLVHDPQGKQPTRTRVLTSVIVLGRKVAIIQDAKLSLEDKLRASNDIAAAADLLNKNADKLSVDEKRAIGEISSILETASPKDYLGATGKGSMTLSKDYFEDFGVTSAWLGSLLAHEGQHYLNSEKYSGADLWRDEQSASRTQLGVGNKIGFNSREKTSLQNWMDDKNRDTMQRHMEKGYTH